MSGCHHTFYVCHHTFYVYIEEDGYLTKVGPYTYAADINTKPKAARKLRAALEQQGHAVNRIELDA